MVPKTSSRYSQCTTWDNLTKGCLLSMIFSNSTRKSSFSLFHFYRRLLGLHSSPIFCKVLWTFYPFPCKYLYHISTTLSNNINGLGVFQGRLNTKCYVLLKKLNHRFLEKGILFQEDLLAAGPQRAVRDVPNKPSTGVVRRKWDQRFSPRGVRQGGCRRPPMALWGTYRND